MTFLVPLALALVLTAVFPILAHALRKGRAQPLVFPAAHLVLEKKSSARQRHRIEDRSLLLLRILILLCLALLAATPFVKCSRLSLSRTDGASVAAALVIDDSASMRARVSGDQTRFDAAIAAAEQLLATARPGDSFSIVLAGYPARVLTPSTTELGAIRDALESLKPTDRRTDLQTALNLARSLQADLAQRDRPIVLLSDLSQQDAVDLSEVVLPEAGLKTPLSNCALLNAVRSTNAVQVELACTGTDALKGRKVEIVDREGKVLAPSVDARDGAVRVPLPDDTKLDPEGLLLARLSPPSERELDMIDADDTCFVLKSAARLSVALRADYGKAGMKTGSGTVLQAAIEALDSGVRVQTLSLLPESASDLQAYSALFIDDPSGFTPEVSDTISTWTRSGGVSVSFLGPGIATTPLGSSFAPFLDAAAKWETTDSGGADPKTAGSLGPLSTTWADIGAQKRATFSPDEDAIIRVRWDDGSPFVLEKTSGRGLLLTVSLPSSIDLSDLSLRPAFLELLDYALTQSAIRRGAQATPVGERWPVASSAVVRDPNGDIVEKKNLAVEDDNASEFVEPELAGPYSISEADEGSGAPPGIRVAMRDMAEHVTQPNEELRADGSQSQKASLTKVGVSREIALLALIFSVLELAYRALRRARGGSPLPQAAS